MAGFVYGTLVPVDLMGVVWSLVSSKFIPIFFFYAVKGWSKAFHIFIVGSKTKWAAVLLNVFDFITML